MRGPDLPARNVRRYWLVALADVIRQFVTASAAAGLAHLLGLAKPSASI